ncbi:SDR family NAD(P)-dependent oxidoreductase [Nocardioides panacisoli]|uniref:SDR family NAD(P)-dependent oxidoreductase n=1 Tax=Nocardioides panacisoli TaxID=627624 RepID=UPI001C62D482|nr:SDR family NAD(P)-dependent oxidoreductase [Nocardioides panacisoli]QYJ04931.1 SDR family NAD(P)-dependent oxidoreductase [Nocardioides panacisoli]
MRTQRLSSFIDTALDKTVAPGYTKIGWAVRRRLPGWPADPTPGSLRGQVAIVTGATSGLGLATAEGLAALGATVHLMVRDTDKAEGVMAGIRDRVPGADLHAVRCDIGDLGDVRRCATELLDRLDRVDVLVHNAGAMPPERTESPQGHELTMSLHVLGPVLLTELLLPLLAGGRTIMVTSGGMYGQRLRDDDPEYRNGEYSPTTAYARSKRGQVELLPVLADRWHAREVQVTATHPGWADTPGVVDSLPTFHRITGPLLRSAAQGADTTVWLAATGGDGSSGTFWHDRRRRDTHLLARTRTGAVERDRFWAWTAAALDLDPVESP